MWASSKRTRLEWGSFRLGGNRQSKRARTDNRPRFWVFGFSRRRPVHVGQSPCPEFKYFGTTRHHVPCRIFQRFPSCVLWEGGLRCAIFLPLPCVSALSSTLDVRLENLDAEKCCATWFVYCWIHSCSLQSSLHDYVLTWASHVFGSRSLLRLALGAFSLPHSLIPSLSLSLCVSVCLVCVFVWLVSFSSNDGEVATKMEMAGWWKSFPIETSLVPAPPTMKTGSGNVGIARTAQNFLWL